MEGDGGLNEEIVGALPGYEVTGMLGHGAMGEVLGGRHERLDRPVAIKRLPPGFAGDPDVRERFGQEARVLASLNHPHIVPVYDYVERDGLCLLVMEALPGGTVWDRFTDQGLTMPTACAVVLATCAGLEYAHAKRVLHRDVKPDNLMFDAEGGLKVTDFGIATVFGGEDTLATADGMIVGTPAYMAPEQAEGRSVGPAADVYAAATMLYELVSGRLPFDTGEEPRALLRARIELDPLPLDQVAPSVPAGSGRGDDAGPGPRPRGPLPDGRGLRRRRRRGRHRGVGPGLAGRLRRPAHGSRLDRGRRRGDAGPHGGPGLPDPVVAGEDEQGAREAIVPGSATIGPDGDARPGRRGHDRAGDDIGRAGGRGAGSRRGHDRARGGSGRARRALGRSAGSGAGETIAPGAVPAARLGPGAGHDRPGPHPRGPGRRPGRRPPGGSGPVRAPARRVDAGPGRAVAAAPALGRLRPGRGPPGGDGAGRRRSAGRA